MERKHMSLAGTWYPDTAGEVTHEIHAFLEGYTPPAPGMFSGGIVPHAGWYFSGSIACKVWSSLAADVDTVILFGMHMHQNSKPVILATGALATPIGDIPVNETLASAMAGRTGSQALSPRTFPDENTLEVQLPFVKHFFPRASMVLGGVPAHADQAMAMGRAAVDAANETGTSIVVVGSTDLTHYGSNFGFTPKGHGPEALDWVTRTNDRQAVDAMLSGDARGIVAQGLTHHNLCCPGAAAAAAEAAARMGATERIELAYATSYDRSPGTSFVGYAGVLFGKPEIPL